MKRILGLDLGTNSIGWALVEMDHANNTVKVVGLGSRILPMTAGEIGDFESGTKIQSSAAQRTKARGPRRLNERYLLRRDRLHLVLNLLDSLPEHYKLEIDFVNDKGEKCGQFKKNKEPKLAYLPKRSGKGARFLFEESYKEMVSDIGVDGVKNIKGKRIPYDWTLYYLRQKALSKKISLEELAWVLLSYNQKRGYEKTESIEKFEDLSDNLKDFGITKSFQEIVDSSKVEIVPLSMKVVEVTKAEDEFGTFFNIVLENGYSYKEYSTEQITELKEKIDEVKIVEKFTILNEEGNDIDHDKTIFRVEDVFELKVKNIYPEETKDKYLKEYNTGWKVGTDYSDFMKFQTAEKDIIEEVFITRLYNSKGELVNPSRKNGSLYLKVSNDPFSEFKLLDPHKSSNWKLLKKKTEKEALQFNSLNGYLDEKGFVKNFISPKIYDVLKKDAQTGNRTKIIGGMFQVVDRSFYREELNQIISTQKTYHRSLEHKETFERCVKVLYPRNELHQNALLQNKDSIQHLLIEDVLLYHRPLKSKRSEIADCKYEIQYKKEDKSTESAIDGVHRKRSGTGLESSIPRKAVSVSHPYFQEFRIWDKLHNLKLFQLEKEVDGTKMTYQDVTKEYFKSETDYQELFDELNNRKSLNQHQFLSYCQNKFKIDYKKDDSNYVWNFREDEEINGNETRVSFATRLKPCGFTRKEFDVFLSQAKERELWHYLYSVSYRERSANNNKSAITFFNRFFKGCDFDDTVKKIVISNFQNYPRFPSKYCAYSEKALKKLIPIIQRGTKNKKYAWEDENWYVKWRECNEKRKKEILFRKSEIDFEQDNIEWTKYTDNDDKVPFPKGLFNAFRELEKVEEFKNLNLTQASYLIYGRHSELAFAKQWNSPEQIRKEIHHELKQHSLNNPVAEKVILEMMQIVADIWDYFGKGSPKYFSRIHLEVARELKKSAKEKAAESKRMSENRVRNNRIRQVLEEFLCRNPYNANPNNFDHFERLKIAEEGAEHTKNTDKEYFRDKNYSKKDIEEILKKPYVDKDDFEKYKLWIEQGYCSPYSGQMIKLTDLFDGSKFNIDHIFPQASITNNSLSNKVVVEVELNSLKDNRTARAFIQDRNGQPYLDIPVCTEEEYVSIVKRQFSGTKRFILLSKDIPKGFTNSQMNNAKHIARKAMELLSHVVREPKEIEFRSKNVLPVSGRVTTTLKRAWQLNHVWTELVSPRFIRLNNLTQSNLFGDWQTSKSGKRYFDCNLDKIIRDKDKSYDIKRIDHRHHALDALVVALCTEAHVNYINNINAGVKSENYGKQKQLERYRRTLKRKIMFTKRDKDGDENNWYFMLPGETRHDGADNSRRDSVISMKYLFKDENTFGSDYKGMILKSLLKTIPSFKQPKSNIRKTSNKYMSYYDEKGNIKDKKSLTKQIDEKNKVFKSTNKRNIAIRKAMHDANPYGESKVNFEIKKITDGLGNCDFIMNEHVRLQVVDAIELNDNNKARIREYLKRNPIKNEWGETIIETAFAVRSPKSQSVFTIRKDLTEISDFKRLRKVANLNLQRDLLLHLATYDSIEIPFVKAKKFLESTFEYEAIKSVLVDNENEFNSIEGFTKYLENNAFKFKNRNYEKLNVFVKDVVNYIDVQNYTIQKNFNLAFSPTGIEELNKKRHVPVKKVKLFERGEGKYSLGKNIGNKHKMVKGANSLFVIDRESDNQYVTIKLKDEIESYHKGVIIESADTINKFSLKAGDLVYLPTEKERVNRRLIIPQEIDNDKVYKFVKSSGSTADFVQCHISSTIYNYNDKNERDKIALRQLRLKSIMEFEPGKLLKNEVGIGTAQDKNQNAMDGKTQVKEICVKLKIDRLGNISIA